MGLFGGSSSASSSQTLTNNVSVNPIFNAGGSNTASSGFSSDGNTAKSDSSATAKDEFGLSASVGAAFGGGSASGGTASLQRTGDSAQPTQSESDPAAIDPTTGKPTESSGNNSILWVGAIVAGGVLWAMTKKKAP